jgi:Phage tail protein (Tail_P2_I)
MSAMPSSYLRYLPAIYSGTGSAFVGDYLKIFEKLLTGVDDGTLAGRRGIQELLAADVIGDLFYPRLAFLFAPTDTDFIPPISGAPPDKEAAILANLDRYIGVPTPGNPTSTFSGHPRTAVSSEAAVQAWLDGFLNWLGGWVDLVPDNTWSIDKKRSVIAQILALYRMRGTPQGLNFLVNLLLGLPLTITGNTYHPAQGEQPASTTPIKGKVTVTISNPVPQCITAEDDPSKAFTVRDSYQGDAPVVSGYFPWIFDVLITLPNADNPSFILSQNNVLQILQLQRQLEQLLARIRPAATRFVIGIVPTMQLHTLDANAQGGSAATLGINTLLGERASDKAGN